MGLSQHANWTDIKERDFVVSDSPLLSFWAELEAKAFVGVSTLDYSVYVKAVCKSWASMSSLAQHL